MVNSEYEKQYLKYITLHNYKSERLDISFCLSEFIDNSISSYDITYWQKNKFDKPLIIDIRFNSKENTYTITDNAGGMTHDELKHAMKIEKNFIANDNKTDNTKKNQYGIGMKSAIFWFGYDAHIYTKKDGLTFKGDYQARDMSETDDVNCKLDRLINEDVIKTESGTKIVIFDVYSNTRPLTDDKLDKVKEFIGARYKNYLDEKATKKCIIRLITDYKNDYKEVDVKPFSLYNSSNIHVFKFDNVGTSKSNDEVENVIKKYWEEVSKYPDKLAEFKEKILNNKYLEFDDEITIPNIIGDRHYKAKVKVYILSKASKTYGGVGIIHSDRYITHPVPTGNKSSQELGGMYNPFKEDSDLEHRWKWLWVDLKLTDIESNEMCQKIYPDKNKTDILFDDNSDIVKDDSITGRTNTSFNSALINLFKRWWYFIEIIREITNSNIEKTNKNKVSNLDKQEKNKLKSSLNYSSKDGAYDVEVERIEADENVLIIEKDSGEINEDGIKKLNYVYNIQNKYFDSLITNSEMEPIIKILIYIDNYIKKIDNNFKGISALIEESLNFYNKEK